ncbi:MAG: chemotaxis response regulator protein-glutamate methylesterase [Candidatus Gastranaerophilales bacterium]|nr:chemotaxis response regulator protein-glutamate methylesterase [Candidatus Gastranaerophilales bacterium]
MNSEHKKINVLIVDDSLFMRRMISDMLKEHPRINVAGMAENGEAALKMVQALSPDVVILDVEMPVMDGLETLEKMNKIRPTPVIMLSSFTKRGAETTIKAFELGISDFVTKPDANTRIDLIKDELITKILVAKLSNKQMQVEIPYINKKLRSTKEKIVVIGSSTGGPRALREVVPYIPFDIPARILIVQHMPPQFTNLFAERLNKISQIKVKEAQEGDCAAVGTALVAPGNYHMEITEDFRIKLNQNPPVKNVRPSVDVTLFSVAKRFKEDLICVILTGMGNDGSDGAAFAKQNKGYCIAEHQSTALIYGMPKCVIEEGNADEVQPLNKVANAIVEAVYR